MERATEAEGGCTDRTPNGRTDLLVGAQWSLQRLLPGWWWLLRSDPVLHQAPVHPQRALWDGAERRPHTRVAYLGVCVTGALSLGFPALRTGQWQYLPPWTILRVNPGNGVLSGFVSTWHRLTSSEGR